MSDLTKYTAKVNLLIPSVQFGNITLNGEATIEAPPGENLTTKQLRETNESALEMVLDQKREVDKLAASVYDLPDETIKTFEQSGKRVPARR